MRSTTPVLAFVLGLMLTGSGAAADWPQFMRGPLHDGDSSDEQLQFPLGLGTCVQLEDAVTTSPAVVAGKVYVVDQMGTAYCIDPKANRILWKSAPDGANARGGNTSSPCVAQGRVYYGTTAGRFHILDAGTGELQKTIEIGWPITGSPTWANDSIYFQHLGAVVHCLDAAGKERWRWDHYKSYQDPKTNKRAMGFPGSWHDPHYGGGEVAVAGKRVVVNLGWDLLCLEDLGASARLAWCQRAPLGKDAGIPMGPAIAEEWIYCGYPSTDQWGNVIRVRLADGSFDEKKDFRGYNWAVLATPALRGATVYWPRHYQGMAAYDFAAGKSLWTARDDSADQRQFTPCIASPALTREHCVFGTLMGQLHVVPLQASGRWPEFKPAPFTFTTPFGKAIASAPVIVDGTIYFGCDDGYLYGLSAAGKLPVPEKMTPLHQVRSRTTSATGKKYGAPVASMNQGNTSFVDDAGLKPPFRLRWAQRPFDLRVQISADADSLYFISEAGTLAALEQATGRIRWRRRLNGPVDGWKQMLLDKSRLYVTRNSAYAGRDPGKGGSEFLAIDAATGATLWSQPWGTIQSTCRSSPVLVGNVVAGFTAEGKPPVPVARAFAADTGKPLWRHELPSSGLTTVAGGVCMLDGIMYFSCGHTWGKGAGSTMAIDPINDKVLWTSREYHVHGYGRPAARDGLLFLGGQSGAPMYCISARDGKLKWQADKVSFSHQPALGEDYFVVRGYGGHGIVRDLATGKPVIRERREVLGGCPDHSCAPVLLSSARLSFAVSCSGLYVRDIDTGKILWQSLGFAPRACTSPTAANGRLFYSPNVNNMLYCFEPVRPEGGKEPATTK